ncbi:hypothetical protein GCM10010361_33010 [Streptomyces olivaceiscleroticus]|uniref:Uncharacterized protein n=1 Tax=Streptomyces olivaceiscleroticus TaxID=68245 RepID=A0ABP3JYS6_9ACTN
MISDRLSGCDQVLDHCPQLVGGDGRNFVGRDEPDRVKDLRPRRAARCECARMPRARQNGCSATSMAAPAAAAQIIPGGPARRWPALLAPATVAGTHKRCQ